MLFARCLLLNAVVFLIANQASAQPKDAPRWKPDGPVNFVAYTPDGKFILTATQDGAVRKWDATEGKEVLLIEKAIDQNSAADNRCRVAALSADGKMIGVVTYGSMLNVYNVTTGKPIRQFKTGDDQLSSAFAVAFAPDGKSVFTGKYQGRSVTQWDVNTGKEIRTVGEQLKAPFPFGRTVLAVSPLGKSFASEVVESKNGQMTGVTIKRWDTATGKELPAAKGGNAGYASIILAPDGKTATWGDSKAGTTRLWDLDTDKEIRLIEGKGRAIVFSRDSKLLAGRDSDRTVLVWDVPTGKVLQKLGTPPASSLQTRDHAIAFSGDGKLLVVVENGVIHQWDVRTGKELATTAEKR